MHALHERILDHHAVTTHALMGTMAEELMFVQFPHPGIEHKPRGLLMEWNRRDHARKYLKAEGRYLRGSREHRGPVEFWGEWEAQSKGVEERGDAPPGYPRWLHEPYWATPRHTVLLQNTDPLVFGEHFLYSNCRQGRNQKLRRLAPGSIVVFGSKLSNEFVIDTVFVVDDYFEDYMPMSIPVERFDSWLRAVVFDPLARSAHRNVSFRLYRGRKYAGSGDIPFSFVPCLPYEGPARGFPRPGIRLASRWLAPKLAMGAKATRATHTELEGLWEQIVRDIAVAGLSLGVELQAPRALPSRVVS
jgi:hypothetical protein